MKRRSISAGLCVAIVNVSVLAAGIVAADLGEGMLCGNHVPSHWAGCSADLAELAKIPTECTGFHPFIYIVESSEFGLLFDTSSQRGVARIKTSTYFAYENTKATSPCRIVQQSFSDSGRLGKLEVRDFTWHVATVDGKVISGIIAAEDNAKVILLDPMDVKLVKANRIGKSDIDDKVKRSDYLDWLYRYRDDGRISRAIRRADPQDSTLIQIPRYGPDGVAYARISNRTNADNSVQTDRIDSDILADGRVKSVHFRKGPSGDFVPAFSRIIRKVDGNVVVDEELYYTRTGSPGIRKLFKYDQAQRLTSVSMQLAKHDEPSQKIDLEYRLDQRGNWIERRMFASREQKRRGLVRVQTREIEYIGR